MPKPMFLSEKEDILAVIMSVAPMQSVVRMGMVSRQFRRMVQEEIRRRWRPLLRRGASDLKLRKKLPEQARALCDDEEFQACKAEMAPYLAGTIIKHCCTTAAMCRRWMEVQERWVRHFEEKRQQVDHLWWQVDLWQVERSHQTRRVVMAAVAQHGAELMCATEEFRGDREVVLTAVQQHGEALEYATEELRGDRKVVLAAVQQHGEALKYATEELRRGSAPGVF